MRAILSALIVTLLAGQQTLIGGAPHFNRGHNRLAQHRREVTRGFSSSQIPRVSGRTRTTTRRSFDSIPQQAPMCLPGQQSGRCTVSTEGTYGPRATMCPSILKLQRNPPVLSSVEVEPKLILEVESECTKEGEPHSKPGSSTLVPSSTSVQSWSIPLRFDLVTRVHVSSAPVWNLESSFQTSEYPPTWPEANSFHRSTERFSATNSIRSSVNGCPLIRILISRLRRR